MMAPQCHFLASVLVWDAELALASAQELAKVLAQALAQALA